jgi:hypothetical protein
MCQNMSISRNIQDEVRVRGNQTGELLVAVGKVAGDVETGLLAKLHLHNTLIPACGMLLAMYSKGPAPS